jgi:hypothetical protein
LSSPVLAWRRWRGAPRNTPSWADSRDGSASFALSLSMVRTANSRGPENCAPSAFSLAGSWRRSRYWAFWSAFFHHSSASAPPPATSRSRTIPPLPLSWSSSSWRRIKIFVRDFDATSVGLYRLCVRPCWWQAFNVAGSWFDISPWRIPASASSSSSSSGGLAMAQSGSFLFSKCSSVALV